MHEGQVLAVFPRLQPLAAVLGWDLLAGDTSARRQMMDFLWDNKSTEPSLNIKHGEVVGFYSPTFFHFLIVIFREYLNSSV